MAPCDFPLSVHCEMKWLATVLCFIASVGLAEIIPADRLVEWSTNTCGIPGGIPVRTNIFSLIPTNYSASQINSSLASCSNGWVVLLTNGTFNLSGIINIPSGVTLRGLGPDKTFLVSAAPGNQRQGIVTIGAIPNNKTAWLPIASGATNGSTNIVLASSDTYIQPGTIVYIDETNSSWLVSNSGAGNGGVPKNDTDDRSGNVPGSHNVSQQVEIKQVVGGSGNKSFNFHPPLMWNYTNHPSLFYRYNSDGGTNYTHDAGVESLTIRNTSTTSAGVGTGNNIAFCSAKHCWVTNVTSLDAIVCHFWFERNYGLEIRGCTISNTMIFTSSGGYGLLLEQDSCCRVEDNIFVHMRDFIKCELGSSYNAILYNYMTDPQPETGKQTASHTGISHSPHPMMNLFEGNVTFTPTMDFYWGSASHFTMLRNWFKGPVSWCTSIGRALCIDERQQYNNVVGNILGSNFQLTNPTWTHRYSLKISPDSSWSTSGSYSTYIIGYHDIDSGFGSDPDGMQIWTNTIAAANYDFIAGQTNWYKPTTVEAIPDSFFYTNKPYYFGTNAWPPFSPSPLRYSETAIPAGYRFVNHSNPPISVLTISPERTKLTNFTTIKIIATAFTNGVTTNLTDLVGFGDYNLTTVNGFFIKTNTGFAIGSSYQWLQGTANVLSSNLPPSLNRQVAANHPLTNSITFSGFTNTALNTSWTWNGSVYSYDVSNFLMSVTTHWQLVSDIFWWTNSNVSPDIGPYVLALGGPTGNSPTVSAFESPTFTAITTTYYLWLDSGSFPGGGTYSDNIIRKSPNAVIWSMDKNTPFASVNDWGQVISGLDPISARLRIWGTWGQFSNYTEVDLTDGRSVSSPAIDTNALKAVMSAKYMSVAH